METAAVGRPFSLGMFYDCRSDKLVPGITLWDKEKLDRDMSVTPKPNTECEIVASESISDKSSSLGVDPSLKASILFGLVSVEGSAKYLKDNKRSTKQARVTLQYKTTTVFKALTMDQLGTGNLTHSEVIDKDLATHVVTGILYGAQAFFVFNQEITEDESVGDIEGNLKMMIERIPLIPVGGDGALKMEDKDREKVKKFSCTFHGDFLLEKSPTTFEEAVKVYQDLPRILSPSGEKAVPVTVHLLPLTTLDSRASKLVRQISLRLVTETENILEGFTELEMWCNDILKSPACQTFPQLSKKIQTFKALCSEFKLGFQGTLSQKIPSIRGGGEEEVALAEVLKKAAESPFNSHRLKQWMEQKDDEANTIKMLMKLMKNTETVSSKNALSDKVYDSETALVFVLTSLDSTEPFLLELDQYLKGSKSNSSDAPEPRRWYSSEDVMKSVRCKAKLFSDFAEANKDRDKKNLRFLAVGLADKHQEGSAIYLYEDGERENFEPPSKPGAVTVSEVTHSTVSLHFSAPSEGAHSVTEYRVELIEKGKEEWNQQLQAEAGEVTVTGLSPNTEYSIRVRAVTSVGVGPALALKTSIRTSPCGPPKELRGTASSTVIRVHWRMPQVTQAINIHRYIVEYGQTQEKIQWKREQSPSEETVIRGLQPETTYSIRILCDCGERGTSRESSTLTITTTAKESPKADPNVRKDQDKTSVMELFRRLHLQDRYENKLTSVKFLRIGPILKHEYELHESDLCSVYLHKLLMLDYRARYIQAKQENTNVTNVMYNETDYFFAPVESISNMSEQITIHPLDLQMTVFHCSDSFLKQKMVTKLSQCQYALPLLVPDPFTGDIECPLWTFRQIHKTWKKSVKDNETVVTMKSMSICKAETLMVLCFHLGSLSGSKSQLINTLINDRHSTFFHRNCAGSSKNRLLLDGVAEIAWYCPSGKPTDSFTDCVAFCNLHGDGLTHHKQLQILMDKASVNVVFVPTLDGKHESATVIKSLLESQKPLIALVENSNNNAIERKTGKYIVGLKDRSQSDVSQELKRIIRDILSGPHESFQLESMSDTGLRVDEHDASCRKGLSSAEKIMTKIESVSVSEVKKVFLLCQGQLWHDWSRINKELYRLKGNIEEEKSKKLKECQKLRENQCEGYCDEIMMYFVEKLSFLEQTEREYFIKWTQILLDDYATDQLFSILQCFNQKWSEVLDLKKQFDDKKRSEGSYQKKTPERAKELELKQKELSKLSQDLQSASCGLEHIFREMAQIYEAHKSLDKPPGQKPTDWSKYPELAAELMISGHPMELMDGDAGHVPLTWISGLMDQVIYKLGNKKVFVLSVLGIQSSGKSTMLNAMFGLQFAVSAGRCTRGAFMQLVKLSEDMKKDFQWDFILVVDTEGLRALELDGNKTIQHDNELATFVVGLGNMTLVNIFGENPSDMQDVLQIVVQAFMRMKKVRLSPSCVFVHQNVTDVSASEKNMDGKRKLQEKLDMMVQLAAEEEDCDAESFSDIIEFDVQKHVKYFAQLWEGSPPMAPPNPGYSECVQDLKSFILEKAKRSPGVTLSDFKTKLEDLWNALLNENFVFSFKNTLEIAVYRKLEVQYGNWTWALRSEMLKVEEQFSTNITYEALTHVDVSRLYGEVTKKYDEIKLLMSEYFDNGEDKDMLIQWRVQHELKLKDFLDELVQELQRKLSNVIEQKKATAEVDKRKTVFENNLLQKSKELALQLKDTSPDDQELKTKFNEDWEKWVSELTKDVKPADEINLEEDQMKAIKELTFDTDLIIKRIDSSNYKDLAKHGDYTNFVAQKRHQGQNILIGKLVHAKDKMSQFLSGHLPYEDQMKFKNLIKDVEKQALEEIKKKPVAQRGYSSSYLREMSLNVITSINQFESQWKYLLKKKIKVDLILFVFYRTKDWILESHSQFIKNNDVRTYLESKKDEYYSVFRSYCKGSSSAVVLAGRICEKLKITINEVACNQTAIDIAGDMKCNVSAFKENRLNLDKYILKSLAEKREFQRYSEYINDPQTYTETFIREEVENLLQSTYKDKCHSFFKQNFSKIQKQIVHALHEASEMTRENKGDINMWLKEFTVSMKLTFGTIDPENFCDVNNFDFLKEEIEKALKSISADLSVDKLKWFRQRPDQILIDQLCDCCWEKCPFCRAVCTNTVKNHKSAKDGGFDHSTPFHRSPSLIGIHIKDSVEMSLSFCTTEVAGDGRFHPSPSSPERSVRYKEYRTAGPLYETWSITSDQYQMSYWHWVVCTFQEDIEKYSNFQYTGRGKIPTDWRKINFEKAMKSLEEAYK